MSVRSPATSTALTAFGIVPFWAGFAVLLVAAALPVLIVTLPPVFDYPNHLARIYVLIHQPESGVLQRFYEIRWRPLPNLAMDLVVPVLARVMPLAWAGKVFLVASFVLLAGGAALLHRAATGRWSPWPLFAFLFLYSRVFLWGFLNYLFGVGLAYVALAAWIALRGKNPLFRLGLSAVFALALFFAHLMACAVYGVLVAGYELGQIWYERPQRWHAAARRLALAGLPFLPPLAILLLAGELGGAGAVSYGRPVRKLDLLFSVFDNYDRAFDIGCFAILVALAAFAYARRYLVLAPPLRGPLALLTLAYLLAPTQIITASAVDHRLPLAIAVLLAAATTTPSLRPQAARVIVLAGLVLFLARMTVIGATWQHSEAVYGRLAAILRQIPEGARLAVAYPPEAIASEAIPKTHVPTLAIIERDAFVPTLFAYPSQQPVLFRPEYRELAARAPPDTLWQALLAVDGGASTMLASYDDVVVLARRPFTLPPEPFLAPIAVEPDFALYRVVH